MKLLLLAVGPGVTSALRRTLPMAARRPEPALLRRRGRRLVADELVLWELPEADSPDLIAECALALGAEFAGPGESMDETVPPAVLLCIDGHEVAVIDRVSGDSGGEGGSGGGASGASATSRGSTSRGEWLPDILIRPPAPLRSLADERLLPTLRWLTTRLAPHQLWLMTVPVTGLPAVQRPADVHRSLRATVTTFREQQA